MDTLFFYILGLILGSSVCWLLMRVSGYKKPKRKKILNRKDPKKNLLKFNAERKEKQKTNKQKILFLAQVKDKIYNDDIQRLLKISDSSSERYLNELEKEGVLQQVGKSGRGVAYKRVWPKN